MVRNEVWAKACRQEPRLPMPFILTEDLAGKAILCILCLERRLGRRLTANDFTEYTWRDDPWHTPRLRARLISPD